MRSATYSAGLRFFFLAAGRSSMRLMPHFIYSFKFSYFYGNTFVDRYYHKLSSIFFLFSSFCANKQILIAQYFVLKLYKIRNVTDNKSRNLRWFIFVNSSELDEKHKKHTYLLVANWSRKRLFVILLSFRQLFQFSSLWFCRESISTLRRFVVVWILF